MEQGIWVEEMEEKLVKVGEGEEQELTVIKTKMDMIHLLQVVEGMTVMMLTQT